MPKNVSEYLSHHYTQTHEFRHAFNQLLVLASCIERSPLCITSMGFSMQSRFRTYRSTAAQSRKKLLNILHKRTFILQMRNQTDNKLLLDALEPDHILDKVIPCRSSYSSTLRSALLRTCFKLERNLKTIPAWSLRCY